MLKYTWSQYCYADIKQCYLDPHISIYVEAWEVSVRNLNYSIRMQILPLCLVSNCHQWNPDSTEKVILPQASWPSHWATKKVLCLGTGRYFIKVESSESDNIIVCDFFCSRQQAMENRAHFLQLLYYSQEFLNKRTMKSRVHLATTYSHHTDS